MGFTVRIIPVWNTKVRYRARWRENKGACESLKALKYRLSALFESLNTPKKEMNHFVIPA